MADNNRISIKKTSRVLAITCVAYTTVATILYNNYQIDLIDYSTPVILGTVATIMSCAALQRLFCSVLYSPKAIFLLAARSYPQEELSLPRQILIPRKNCSQLIMQPVKNRSRVHILRNMKPA